MSVYILDSNFFIQAHRVYYPLDVVPSFWNIIRDLAEQGVIISIDKVKNELFKNDDDLKAWCETNLPASFFKDSSEVLSEYSSVVSWAVSRNDHYLQKAIDEFLDADEADAWLTSYALANGNVIVTHEVSNPNQKNKIKIPEACNQFGVQFINTIDMFRQLNIRF